MSLVDRAKDNVKELSKPIMKTYKKGVVKTQNTLGIELVSKGLNSVYKMSPEELIENKSGILRKIRQGLTLTAVVVTPFFIGLPIKMVDDAIQRNVDHNNAKSYIRIYDKEIKLIDKKITEKRAKGEDVTKLVKYKYNLERGRMKMQGYLKKVDESKAVKEDGTCSTSALEYYMTENDKEAQWAKISEPGRDFLNFMYAKSDNDEELLESFLVVNESLRDASRSVVHAARKTADAIHKKVVDVDKIAEPIDNQVNATIKNIKDSMTEEKKEEIILGENKFKLLRIIRKCVVYGGLVLVHPALAAIAFLVSLANDKRIENNEKKKIIKGLEEELEVVKEKIEDAKRKDDNKAKYDLMRIEHKLENDLARIKYNLD